MKAILFASALLLAAVGAAVAGEGQGEPFPVRSSGLGTFNTATLGFARTAPAVPAGARLLRDNSSMGLAQTSNSLPPGFAGNAGGTRS